MPRFNLVRRGRSSTTIPTPVLTKTNAANAPLAFTITVSGYLDSYYWNLQMASDSGFTTGVPGESAIRDEVRMVTTTDYTDETLDGNAEADTFVTLKGQGAGARYARIRLGHSNTAGDGFTWGAWSNTVTETITTAVAFTWNPDAKDVYATLAGSDLIASAVNELGGPAMVVGFVGKTTGKWYLEIHATTTGAPFGTMVAGFVSYSYLPTGGVVPGSADSQGITYHGSGDVYLNSANAGGSSAAREWAPTGTHILGLCVDADNDKVWFAKNNSFVGDPAAGTGGHNPSSMTAYYPFYGAGDDGTVGALKTVTSQFTYSPPAGFLPFGGN